MQLSLLTSYLNVQSESDEQLKVTFNGFGCVNNTCFQCDAAALFYFEEQQEFTTETTEQCDSFEYECWFADYSVRRGCQKMYSLRVQRVVGF